MVKGHCLSRLSLLLGASSLLNPSLRRTVEKWRCCRATEWSLSVVAYSAGGDEENGRTMLLRLLLHRLRRSWYDRHGHYLSPMLILPVVSHWSSLGPKLLLSETPRRSQDHTQSPAAARRLQHHLLAHLNNIRGDMNELITIFQYALLLYSGR